MSAVEWSDAERRGWKWPDHLKPSEWAEREFVLPPAENAEPGPYRNKRNPLLVAIMDAFVEPGVEEIVCIKAGQVGWSTAIRILVGWAIDHEPGPALMVLPDQKSAEELFDERLKPLIEFTPAVKRHATGRAWDVKKRSIRFDTMSLYAAWAGSSQSTKSRAIRYAFCDEVDEFPVHSGKGGDPIAKVKKRLTTFSAKRRARLLIGSTPTTRTGNVFKHAQLANVKRYAWVPCPHCGKYQRLEWSRIKWPTAEELGESGGEMDRVKHAARVSGEDLAWYECEHCKGKCIEAVHKAAMLRRHVWAGEDQAVTIDGRVVGPAAKSRRRVSFHYPAQYSPWVRWSEMAAEFILAKDDAAALMDFVNQSLAEPWEDEQARPREDVIRVRAKGASEAGLVPAWARVVIATADTQGTSEKDGYFWYVIRAWGRAYRSQLLDYGIANSKAELSRRTLERQFAIEGRDARARVFGLWVDSGGRPGRNELGLRWNEIYEMAKGDHRIHPTKGASDRRVVMLEQRPQKRHGIILSLIDTEQAKDKLFQLIYQDPDETRWMPHKSVTDDYLRQMCSEAKIFDPATGRTGWEEIIRNSNHLWDCESQQVAVAWHLGMDEAEAAEELPPARGAGEEQAKNPFDYRGRW